MSITALFVLTSHDQLGDTGRKTGFYLEEFTESYYKLFDHGIKITIASPKGGLPPIDPISKAPDAQTESTKRFYQDPVLKEKLSQTLKLTEVKADDYDCIFYPGGHGPLWDLVSNTDSIKLIESFYNHGKLVAAIGHGPAVFLEARKHNGDPLVKGQKITAFSNSEEEELKYENFVPFFVEEELQKKGAIYDKAERKWEPYVAQEDRLITGQNEYSAKLLGAVLLDNLTNKIH